MGFFKYFNFFAENLTTLLAVAGFDATPFVLTVLLPVGISFYTFQTMSYTIDIYQGHLEPTRGFLDFALFVSFFPQLVAGPIERARNLLPQINAARRFDRKQFYEGCWLIYWGLYHLNYAQIRRSHRRWSCGDSGTRVNSVISQVVFSAVSLPV